MKMFPSAVGVLNAIAGVHGRETIRSARYGQDKRHGLDIYQASAPQPSPTVVFFYGGGWEEGERGDYFFLGSALAARGLTTVIPDYRVYPTVRFPAFVEDAAAALRWTKDHIAAFGGDHRRLIVMGHSAGAYIAAMLAFDRKRLAGVGLDAKHDLRAIIGLAGPYDFLPLRNNTLKKIFDTESGLAATQPINFVGADTPPALLITGRRDRSVDPGNSARLADRIASVGGKAEVRFYGGVNHRTLMGAFSLPLRFLCPVLDDVVEFATRASGGGMPSNLSTRSQSA